MRRTCLALALAAAAVPALAEGWTTRTDVAATLSDAHVDFPTAHQVFRADGTTSYDAGTPAPGRWAARGGRYCSQWPPDRDWECFDLATDGARVHFTDDRGNATVGTFR